MYQKYFKRLFDIVLSLIAIIVLSPIMLITAILVRVNLGSPVIFKQARPGKDEKIFNMYKFRSMNSKTDENGQLLSDDLRLTKFGKMLRSTSLDELPELINIIKGDMSIVGPRPLAVIYLSYYNERERKRHCIRPGLTGLAQVSGRNAISWDEKFEYDVNYAQRISIAMDVKIIVKTLFIVLGRKNVGLGSITLESFHVIRKKESELKGVKT